MRIDGQLVVIVLGATLLALVLSGCASLPEPRAPRVAVSASLPAEVIALPAPPQAFDCAPHICYALADAERLADTLDAAFALQEQAQALLAAARALDGEAGALHQHLRDQDHRFAELVALHRRELWPLRLGFGGLLIMLIGAGL